MDIFEDKKKCWSFFRFLSLKVRSCSQQTWKTLQQGACCCSWDKGKQHIRKRMCTCPVFAWTTIIKTSMSSLYFFHISLSWISQLSIIFSNERLKMSESPVLPLFVLLLWWHSWESGRFLKTLLFSFKGVFYSLGAPEREDDASNRDLKKK